MKAEITIAETGIPGLALAPFTIDIDIPNSGGGIVKQLLEHFLIGKEAAVSFVVAEVDGSTIQESAILTDNLGFLPAQMALFDAHQTVSTFFLSEFQALTGGAGLKLTGSVKVVA